MKFNHIPKTEYALESDTSESDRMQCPLVGIPESAERGKVLLLEVFSIMGKDERAVIDANAGLSGTRVVGVL